MGLRLAVIGAGPAGMAAASRVKRLSPDSQVVVFEKTKWVSFALCGIPYYIGDVFRDEKLFYHYPPEFFIQERGIDIRLYSRVVEIESSDRKLVYVDRDGNKNVFEWDYLVIATGARAKIPDVPGVENNGVYTIHHVDDAIKLKQDLLHKNYGKIIVVGLGYTGLELAENLIRLGRRVEVVGRSKHPLSRILDEDLGKVLEENIRQHVPIHTGEKLIEIKRRDGKLVVVTDKNEYVGDAVILATGIEPNTDLAKQIGLRIGETGAIWVDEYLRTSLPYIFAAGDNVETTHIVTGKKTWSPFAQVANKMGYVVGSNIAGKNIVFPGVAGTSVVKLFGIVVAGTGLKEEKALQEGFEPVKAVIEAPTKPRYIPGHGKVLIKVIADKKTGRLLGAQAIGGEDAFWRVNVVAGLLYKKATIEDLFFTDLGYAPPVAAVWDALIIAARVLMRHRI